MKSGEVRNLPIPIFPGLGLGDIPKVLPGGTSIVLSSIKRDDGTPISLTIKTEANEQGHLSLDERGSVIVATIGVPPKVLDEQSPIHSKLLAPQLYWGATKQTVTSWLKENSFTLNPKLKDSIGEFLRRPYQKEFPRIERIYAKADGFIFSFTFKENRLFCVGCFTD